MGIEEKIINIEGTIKYVPLEGGFYGIIGDDGEYYDPTNLLKKFQKDGLRVKITAKLKEDMASIHMWGKVIEILEITLLP